MNREVIFERNLTGSYMKISSLKDDTFDEKLLLEKKIPGLLSMDKCLINGKGEFWISITGTQSLDTFLGVKTIGIDFIEQLIISITSQIELLEKNLINIDCLVLEASMIYIENQQQTFSFVVLPDQENPLSEQFRELMEFLLTKIDHQDQQAVQAGYQLYEKTLNEGYSIKDIRASIVEKRVDALGEQKKAAIEDLFEPEEKTEADYVKEMMEDYGGGLASLGSRIRKMDPTRKNSREESEDDKEVKQESEKKYSGEYSSPKSLKKTDHKRKRKKGRKGQRRQKGQKRSNRQERQSLLAGIHRLLFPENMDDETEEDDILLTPDHYYEEEVPEIHPTVCLGAYRAQPEGLLLYEGNENFSTIRITGPTSLIGQGKDVDISLKKDTISHYHARISISEGRYYIEDLNSTNGTCINGEFLPYKEKKELKMNDILQFADVRFRFV